jgi:hypothetical protein
MVGIRESRVEPDPAAVATMASSGDESIWMRRFQRHVGIDYSGAEAPETPIPGVRVYVSEPDGDPAEVPGPHGRDRRWSRRTLAAWLEAVLQDEVPTIVGIDHALSFPVAYFERHRIPCDWDVFLEDFRRHWPTDREGCRIRDLRRDRASSAFGRLGETRWRREADLLCRAKSVFHFGVPGSVASSTHAGLPWILLLRRTHGLRVHFWPFDGWAPPEGTSVIAEAYPALYPGDPRDAAIERHLDEHRRDARRVARWLADADADGSLPRQLRPDLSEEVLQAARTEGWILGVHASTARWPLPPLGRRPTKPGSAFRGFTSALKE